MRDILSTGCAHLIPAFTAEHLPLTHALSLAPPYSPELRLTDLVPSGEDESDSPKATMKILRRNSNNSSAKSGGDADTAQKVRCRSDPPR